MKVLLVNDIAAPVGGAEVFTRSLRAELVRRDHDARIFASRARADGRRVADFECHGSTGRFRTLNRAANPLALHALRRTIEEFRPDVVHVRMFLSQLSPLVLRALRRVPVLYHAAWYELICPTGLKMFPGGEVCRRPAGRACRACLSARAWTSLMLQRSLLARWRGVFDLYVANSRTMHRRLTECGIAPTVVVHNGVPRRARRPSLAEPPIIGYAGRFTPEKGVETLIEAFVRVARRHRGVRLLLAGEGSSHPTIVRSISASGLADRVTLTGFLERSEMERVFDCVWIQVIPSVHEEPFGLAVAEAMMRGTAVVATDLGGPAELVRHGETGLLVPPRDPTALAEALGELMEDPPRVEEMGARGRELAFESLSIERCVDRFLELYSQLVRARGNQRS